MKKKRIMLVIVACVLVASTYVTPKYVLATEEKTERLSGSNRYTTSLEISKEGWNTSNNIVIATGENYADALCAVPFAGSKDAPIILTPKRELISETVNEIKRLGAKNAYIIGGEGVVSSNISNQLKSLGLSVTRFGGKDRYETSVKVGEQLPTSNGAVFVTGSGFADALSIAPIAAEKGMPILLTPKDNLSSYVSNFINGKSIPNSYVIGGTGVISDSVKNKLSNPTRIGGKDRYETNFNIINHFQNDISFGNVYVATGQNFPDALSGAALAPKYNSPLILASDSLSSSMESFLSSKGVGKAYILGGSAVVNDSIENKMSTYSGGYLEVVSVE